MTVIGHCQDCGEPLDRSEIAVEVREWDALHASNNERGREVERLSRELAAAVSAGAALYAALRDGHSLGDEAVHNAMARWEALDLPTPGGQ